MQQELLYDTIYALAARGACGERLFGAGGAAEAHEAFVRSVPNEAFPELWFELPLLGDPWFDLHVLTKRTALAPDETFVAERTGGYPELFAWFAGQAHARQLALSWDVGSRGATEPAVQLLVNAIDAKLTCDFLTRTGRADAVEAYRSFLGRLPSGWFACYAGVFPYRPDKTLRVECIPRPEQQQAYAQDPARLVADLRQVGLEELGDTLVPRCQLMAQTPFDLEFQFDVDETGSAGHTVSASVRTENVAGYNPIAVFREGEAGDALMRQVEAWGLCDERWRLLPQAAFAKRAKRGDDSLLLYCYPSFIKLRWRDGEQVDAKTYLIAGVK